MYKYSLVLLMLLGIGCSKKKMLGDNIKKIIPEKNRIYLFYRKTDSKNGIIAQSYNKWGSQMSHIAIGLTDEKNKFTIYHILEKDVKKTKNDIWSSTVEDFYQAKNEKIIGAEVWKSQEKISDAQLSKLRSTIDSLQKTNTKFDFDFDFNDHHKMYCSEFVYYLLHSISQFKISPSLSEKKLSGINKTFLGRSTLHYLPVDFLRTNKNFVEIYSEFDTESKK
ncbi:hypothetical protein [Chryseobacterium tongliaoense]|uniref:hypothetical protein n=1 Tax=Chryseobacterium tongliaoense TaxID=3240933 RepID=UPI003511C875